MPSTGDNYHMSKKDKLDDSYEMPEDIKEKAGNTLGRIKTFFVKNRRKNLKGLLIGMLCIILIVALMGGAYITKLLGLINKDDHTGDPNATFAEDEEDHMNAQPISDVIANSIDQYCIQWATAGDKLQSSKVINILMIGQDGASDETNSDTIIIASINTEKKTITLCSVMRDSYTYSNIGGSARCDKINHTYAWGGADALKTTLENDLKIVIDHYVSINFEGFRNMIDQIGGVDVTVTEAEANYMNRTTQMKGFEAGESVHMDGKHALVFARIRKLDSDIERTRRQRIIITSVLNKLKNSSAAELNNLVNKFLPYVSTDCSNKAILSYASNAISNGWLNYEVSQLTEPSMNYRAEGKMTTYSSRTSPLFIWIVDWVLVAKEVQLAFYGTTNIEIDEATHVSPVDIINGNAAETTTYAYSGNGGAYYYTTNGYEETTEENGFSFSVPNFFDRDNYTGIIPDFTRPTTERSTEERTTSEWSMATIPDGWYTDIIPQTEEPVTNPSAETTTKVRRSTTERSTGTTETSARVETRTRAYSTEERSRYFRTTTASSNY